MQNLSDLVYNQIKDIEKEENRIGNETAVVKIVDLLFDNALSLKSSDIHIDFKENKCNVRYRIDGLLREIISIPKYLGIKVISRIKVLAGMDITQTRLPQDGRKTIEYNKNKIDIRLSTLPTNYGESIVLRILPKNYIGLNLTELGLSECDYKKILKIISRKWGMVLVAGPTGCGKTTTLYAILKEINNIGINIISLEDPIECNLSFVRQSQIKYDIGYNFSNALRSVLRQDPDVIMVGEIRDEETLNTAFKAALTGHMVFSTLHTRDTRETISRLREMGLPNYIISSALKGVIAQRLARKICEKCDGYGCIECDFKGLRGRIGIFEVLEINKNIGELIFNNCSIDSLKDQILRMGIKSFQDDAVSKVKNKITTNEEILRVLGQYD